MRFFRAILKSSSILVSKPDQTLQAILLLSLGSPPWSAQLSKLATISTLIIHAHGKHDGVHKTDKTFAHSIPRPFDLSAEKRVLYRRRLLE